MNKQLGKDDVEVGSQEVCYDGFFRISKLTLRHRKFDGETTPWFTRELFQRGHAVGVLLYDPRIQRVALVEQFRIGALAREGSPWLHEIVAGMIDTAEGPREVAARECFEEAGVVVTGDQLIPICDYLVSPGGVDERFYLYCALVDLENVGGVFGLESEHEDIRLATYSIEEAQQLMASGGVDNSATIICLQWLLLNFASLGEK